ncbi:MAG: hypothetical protein ACKOFW_01190, partial [Planctomycetaceae bacterium]
MSETNPTLDQLSEPVQQALAGLAARAKAAGPPDQFFNALLEVGLSLLDAEAGGVWLIDPQNRLVLESERGLADSDFLADPMLRVAFEQPFRTAIEQRRVLSHSSQQERLEGPGRIFTALLAGLGVNARPAGLLQFVEQPTADPAARPQRLTILGHLSQLLTQKLEKLATSGGAAAGSAPVASSTTATAGGAVASAGTERPSAASGASGVGRALPSNTSSTSSTGVPAGGSSPAGRIASGSTAAGSSAGGSSSGGFPVPAGLSPAAGGGVPPGLNLPAGIQLPPGVSLPTGIMVTPGSAGPAGGVGGATGGGTGGGTGAGTGGATATGAGVVPHEGLLALHEHLRVRDAATVIANESRRWLEVDRVAVAERVGKRLKIQAISGSVSVNARSNVVQLLTRLVDKVVQSGERLVFEGESHKLPPSIETPLADYLHESRSRAVMIEPLFDPIAVKKFK